MKEEQNIPNEKKNKRILSYEEREAEEIRREREERRREADYQHALRENGAYQNSDDIDLKHGCIYFLLLIGGIVFFSLLGLHFW